MIFFLSTRATFYKICTHINIVKIVQFNVLKRKVHCKQMANKPPHEEHQKCQNHAATNSSMNKALHNSNTYASYWTTSPLLFPKTQIFFCFVLFVKMVSCQLNFDAMFCCALYQGSYLSISLFYLAVSHGVGLKGWKQYKDEALFQLRKSFGGFKSFFAVSLRKCRDAKICTKCKGGWFYSGKSHQNCTFKIKVTGIGIQDTGRCV